MCENNDPLPESHRNHQECRKVPVAATICKQWKTKFYQTMWGHREHSYKVSLKSTLASRRNSQTDLLLGFILSFSFGFCCIFGGGKVEWCV